MAMVFASEFPALDGHKVLKLCVLHDLGEALHGDVPAVQQHQNPDKSGIERADLRTLMKTLPARLFDDFMSL
jgi:putative hydrolase of HD superfamily